jgi:hypothetical protein
MRTRALFQEIHRCLDSCIHLNVNSMFEDALRNTRLEMSPAEKHQFYEKYFKHMNLAIDQEGNVSIELRRS